MRGKHGAQAERRREEVAEATIRELQTQLRDAHSAIASLERRVANEPAYQARIAFLEAQIANNTSERLTEMEAELTDARARLKYAREAGKKINLLWNRLFKLAQAKLGLRDDHDGFETLAKMIGAWGDIFQHDWAELRAGRTRGMGAGKPIAGSHRALYARFGGALGRDAGVKRPTHGGVSISPEGGLDAANLISYNSLEFLESDESQETADQARHE